MKATLFCIICLCIAFVVSNNADKQMQQDTQKMVHQSYTM
jgi:preprotein translocase subunit SecG